MAPSALATLEGYVSGMFSAAGMSDDIFAALGEEEGVVRQVCTWRLNIYLLMMTWFRFIFFVILFVVG